MTDPRALIIYHNNCIDGYTAAWIAQKALREQSHTECILFPAEYGDTPPDTSGREVYVLDFSYPRETLIKMHGEASILGVFDHHKTAKEDCEGLAFCEFDMEKSGCMLAWEFFYPNELPPNWIKCIDDRDRWKFKMGATKNVHAYISSFPFELRYWDAFYHTPVVDMAARGHDIKRSIDNEISKNMREAIEIHTWDNHIQRERRAIALNVPYLHRSETGHMLLEAYEAAEFSITYFQKSNKDWQYDLRARECDDIDVSEIAKHFGGGGHANAAGFKRTNLLRSLR